MKNIGLCGAIGSGKSTIAGYLSTLGYKHVNSDKALKTYYQAHPKCYDSLVEYFKTCGWRADLYDVNSLTEFLFGPFEMEQGYHQIAALNAFNAFHVLSAVRAEMVEPYVIEMAVLTEFAYMRDLGLSAIIHVVGDQSGLEAVRRDTHRSAEATLCIHKYQKLKLLELNGRSDVFTLHTCGYDGKFLQHKEIEQSLLEILNQIEGSP